jgi:hypothetical protein
MAAARGEWAPGEHFCAMPAAKPRKFASTALPSAWMAARKASSEMGSTPQAVQRAQQHGVERGLRLLGEAGEIGNDGVARTAPGPIRHRLRIEPASARSRLLVDGEDAR